MQNPPRFWTNLLPQTIALNFYATQPWMLGTAIHGNVAVAGQAKQFEHHCPICQD